MLKGKGLHALSVLVWTTAVVVVTAGAALADTSHKIRQGDTVYDLAKKYGVSVRSIQRANNLTDRSVLALGRKLHIPGAGPTRSAVIASKRELQHTEQPQAVKENAESSREECTAPQTESNDTTHTNDVVRTAFNYRGTRYRYGGTSRGGFDCSGFTRYVYAKYGVALPHSSASQFSHGQPVQKSELKQGDLVFFSCSRRGGISHVGIYIGNDRFIHASNVRRGVTVDSLSSAYYAARYRGARRIK